MDKLLIKHGENFIMLFIGQIQKTFNQKTQMGKEAESMHVNVKTKYSIGERVYVLFRGVIVSTIITNVLVDVSIDETGIGYLVDEEEIGVVSEADLMN